MYNAGIGNQTIPGKTTAPAFGYGASVLFVPGWTFLGATYSAAVVQGAYIFDRRIGGQPAVYVKRRQRPARQYELHADRSVVEPWPRLVYFAVAFTVVGPDGSQCIASLDQREPQS